MLQTGFYGVPKPHAETSIIRILLGYNMGFRCPDLPAQGVA